MSYLRGNYLQDKTKKILEKKGFRTWISPKIAPSSSTIDLMAINTEGNRHYFFEFKNKIVSTLDVARFHSSIQDTKVSGEKSAFIVSDSVFTGSAIALSKKLNIDLIQIDKENIEEAIDKINSK